MHDSSEGPSPRPGSPRRPVRHRARPGGSARPAGPAPHPAPAPTRQMPVVRPDSPRTSGTRYPDDGRGTPGPGGGGPEDPGLGRQPVPGRDPRRPRRGVHRVPRPVRLGATLIALVLVVLLGWGAGLTLWANSRIEHVDALSGRDGTAGTTYLIAGSDRRGGDAVSDDGTLGQRSDTLMLLHKTARGKSYLVSLPRDTLVDIPGYGKYKLNAAYSLGGPKLLVKTVEQFSGLTIDHFVEIGFDGVEGIVDAVGTVNLCIDQDVDDRRSGLKMTKGCHDTGGEQALAFVRARYFDPTADIGRQKRQQQFVGALMKRVMSPGVLLNPIAQVKLAGAGSDAMRTDPHTGMIDIARSGLGMRSAMKDGTSMSIPIKDPQYQTRHSGVAILTDDAEVRAFFESIKDGTAKPPATP